MPDRRLCFSFDETITVWVRDTSTYIDVRIQSGVVSFRLDIGKTHNGYYVQGLWSDAYRTGARRRGFGTLLVNTGIAYLHMLPNSDRTTLEGRTPAAPDDVSGQAEARRRFWQRWSPTGETGSEDPDIFRFTLAALRPLQGKLLLGRYPAFIPIAEFRACAHEHE